MAFFIRQQSGGTPTGAPPGPGGSESPRSAAPDSPAYRPQPEIAAWDPGYLDYLKDARRSIELCSWACRDWSAPYDGEKPSPSAAAAYPEHLGLQPGGGGQQRADAVAARSERSGGDGGEWAIAIGQSNCIALTPRSKKRSLQQRDQLLQKPAPPHLGLAPLPTSPPAPDNPTAASCAPLFNGTAGPGESQPGPGRELEAKKAKRHSDHQEFLDENANQNGCPSKDAGDARTPPPDAADASAQQRAPTVESLIRELLEQSPGEARPPDHADVECIGIEAFTRELKELEARATPPPCAAETSPGDRRRQDKDPEEKMAADVKGESSETGVRSPAGPLVQGSCQPYTGKNLTAGPLAVVPGFYGIGPLIFCSNVI